MLNTPPPNLFFVLLNEYEPDMKTLLGRAFLLEVEKGDMEKMVLFARAFLVHTLMSGAIRRTAS